MQRPWVTSAAYEAAIALVISARKASGLSQRDLAAKIGKPRSFISKIESRERRLDIVEFLVVANALETDGPSLLADISKALPPVIEF